MTVTRLVSDNPLLYAPLATVGINRGDADDAEWSPEAGGPIRTRARPPYDYTVTVAARDSYQGILAQPLRPETRAKYLQVPADFDPRLCDLARKITADAKTPTERVGAVVDYLMSTHRYSLTFHLTPGARDPLADFLLSEPKKGAHCEYFAASAAMLLRCVGVPTRYVTGYYAHESGGQGITVVRGRDAHAWCEAWVDGVGWVTADATPGDGRPDADNTPVERWRRAWEWMQDRFREFAEWMADLPQQTLNAMVGVVVGGFALYGFVRFTRRRRSPPGASGFSYSPPDPRIEALIPRFEAVFARRGAPFPPERTYREHLDSLADGELGGLAESGQQFVRYYDAARFGSRLDDAAVDAMRRLIEEMETKKR
jgi:transglutaminase-like putative cysteine protease